MMSTGERAQPANGPEGAVDDLLAYAELLNSPRLARLYSYALQYGPVDVETVKADLELPHSTAYKYISELEEMGVLTRQDDVTPTRIGARPFRITLDTDHGSVIATPVLVAAIGRQLDTEDIQVFVERQGIAKLAAAVHYTLRVMDGELTQRTAAERLGVHPVEAMTVITALQDIIEAAADFDPYLDAID